MQPVSAREWAPAAQVSGNWVRPIAFGGLGMIRFRGNGGWATGRACVFWPLEPNASPSSPYFPFRVGAIVGEGGRGKSLAMRKPSLDALLCRTRWVVVFPSDLPMVADGRTPQTHSVWELWAASFRVGRRAQSTGGGIARQHLAACGVEMLIHTAK